MQPDDHNAERQSLQELAARLKKQDREALAALPPEAAQAEVDQILLPHLWQVTDPSQLAWPGDLADEDDDEETADGGLLP
ncbi:MAG TPA: hypothetical protein VML55_15445 [Planctomycetaceae bacterium]|nr:hypothetical protein [Planctomycetaceae bacterium]